uniref:Uncharacterized protein n=1 Tax=Lepeophtheirus salmonis TaxID=72036 RepID=A0A0K2U3H4_LEPSM
MLGKAGSKTFKTIIYYFSLSSQSPSMQKVNIIVCKK